MQSPLMTREPKNYKRQRQVVHGGSGAAGKAAFGRGQVNSAAAVGPGQRPPPPGWLVDPASARLEERLVLCPPLSSLSPHRKSPFLAVAHLRNTFLAVFTLQGAQSFLWGGCVKKQLGFETQAAL